MYESPIEKIYGEIQTQMVQEDENMVMEAVREVGINVDKEELINALQYDRNQYTKGYEDGKNEVLNKIRAEINELPSYVAKFNGGDFAIHIDKEKVFVVIDKYKDELERKWRAEEIEHKCHNCKHYLRGEYDGSCGSYICENYSGWEQGVDVGEYADAPTLMYGA